MNEQTGAQIHFYPVGEGAGALHPAQLSISG